MATAEPLTPPWLRDYRDRVLPRLTPVQQIACEAAWGWFAELWKGEQVDSARLQDLSDEALPLFEKIERSSGQERDEAIVALVERLRAVDMSLFFPNP